MQTQRNETNKHKLPCDIKKRLNENSSINMSFFEMFWLKEAQTNMIEEEGEKKNAIKPHFEYLNFCFNINTSYFSHFSAKYSLLHFQCQPLFQSVSQSESQWGSWISMRMCVWRSVSARTTRCDCDFDSDCCRIRFGGKRECKFIQFNSFDSIRFTSSARLLRFCNFSFCQKSIFFSFLKYMLNCVLPFCSHPVYLIRMKLLFKNRHLI